jgi:predicted P-loop ATPase
VNFLPVNAEAIPQTLRMRDRWVYWRLEPDAKTGKLTKQPHIVGDVKDRRASSTNAETWSTFEATLAGLSNGFSHHGVGFIFDKDDALVFFDLDHVRNPISGEIAPWAAALVEEMASYTEISPSGTGLHTYALGSFSGPGKRVEFSDGSAVELYCKGRYSCVTGRPLAGLPVDLQPLNAQAFYDRLKHGRIRTDGTPSGVEGQPETEPTIEPRPVKTESSGVRELLDKFGLIIKAVEDPYQGETEVGVRYTLEFCPFYEPHKDAAVFDFPSGPVFSCFHDSCAGKTWRHVCSKYEYKAPDLSDLAWRHQLIAGENGKPKSNLHNAILFLRHSPEWKNVLRYNEFSLTVECADAAPWPQSTRGNWDDDHDTRATFWLQENGILISSKLTAEAVRAVAREHKYHPLRAYLTGLIWDGRPRIATWLADYLKAQSTPLNNCIGQYWLISGCARIMSPGAQCDHTLLLIGVQGAGKSTALRILASDAYFTDRLSPFGDKDSLMELAGRWIVEMSEFTNRRSELERKSFLTSCADCFRPPYARTTERIPRQCIFAATSNDESPLHDFSGDRRYWPVSVAVTGRIDLNRLRSDRDQLWAESFAAYKDGESWWPDFAEFQDALTEEQHSRYREHPWDQTILEWVAAPSQREEWIKGQLTSIEPFDSTYRQVTLHDVLIHALDLPPGRQNQNDLNTARACLIHAGWRQQSRRTRVPGTNRNVQFYTAPQPKMTKLGEL